MRFPLLPAFMVASAAVAPALADDVHLTNGESYQGVVAHVAGSRVKILLPSGRITLPGSQVARIDRSPSALEEYFRRRDCLERSADAAASDWLELARWSKNAGLNRGIREAALAAAELDPHLTGLAPLLRPLGYRLDDELDRWVSEAELLTRRGFVFYENQWLTRQERGERIELRRLELERLLVQEEAARATAQAQATQRAEQERERDLYGRQDPLAAVAAFALPVVVVPSFFVAPATRLADGPPPQVVGERTSDRGYSRLIGRQPGSFIPIGSP